jgi:hypothetical protein
VVDPAIGRRIKAESGTKYWTAPPSVLSVPKVRVVIIATQHEHILLVNTDLTRPPAVSIHLAAARLPMERSRKALKQ